MSQEENLDEYFSLLITIIINESKTENIKCYIESLKPSWNMLSLLDEKLRVEKKHEIIIALLTDLKNKFNDH